MKPSKNKEIVAHPFVKWAGGKSKVISHVMARLPEKVNTYFEPMVGGGFVLFYLARLNMFERAVISDTNPDLMNAYRVIKKDVEGLISELSNGNYVYDKKVFLDHRGADFKKLSPIKKAARFIYLNKTCFNGLYRVNKGGGFNTPFGRFKNPTICDSDNLRAISKVLKKVKIRSEDFVQACADAAPGDAVYFDPPYIPLSKTSKFTNYTSDGFSMKDHVRLSDFFTQLSTRSIRVVLSNSSAPAAVELYREHDIDYLKGARNVGGPAEYRKAVSEILVFAGPRQIPIEDPEPLRMIE